MPTPNFGNNSIVITITMAGIFAFTPIQEASSQGPSGGPPTGAPTTPADPVVRDTVFTTLAGSIEPQLRIIIVDGLGTGTTFDVEVTLRIDPLNPDCDDVDVEFLPATTTIGAPSEWYRPGSSDYPELLPTEVFVPQHVDALDVVAVSLFNDMAIFDSAGNPNFPCQLFDLPDYISVTTVGP